METNTTPALFPDEPKPLSPTLNVLTMLTFIGCAFSYFGLLWNTLSWSSYNEQLERLQEMEEQLEGKGFLARLMSGSVENFEKSYENRYVLLAAGLIFTTFCLIGALQMRKLKKTGYPIYVIGELAPIVLTAVILGSSAFSGIAIGFSFLIALVFVILYSTQRKYLVN